MEYDDPGYQGRDVYKQIQTDTYEAQDYDIETLGDQFKDTVPSYGSYFLYEMNNSTKTFKIASFVNMTS